MNIPKKDLISEKEREHLKEIGIKTIRDLTEQIEMQNKISHNNPKRVCYDCAVIYLKINRFLFGE